MEINNRISIYDNLRKYCHHAKDSDFIEVTEWTNGEGWDIQIKDRNISLTYGELDAINYLIKALEYSDK